MKSDNFGSGLRNVGVKECYTNGLNGVDKKTQVEEKLNI